MLGWKFSHHDSEHYCPVSYLQCLQNIRDRLDNRGWSWRCSWGNLNSWWHYNQRSSSQGCERVPTPECESGRHPEHQQLAGGQLEVQAEARGGAEAGPGGGEQVLATQSATPTQPPRWGRPPCRSCPTGSRPWRGMSPLAPGSWSKSAWHLFSWRIVQIANKFNSYLLFWS